MNISINKHNNINMKKTITSLKSKINPQIK